ncbi:Uncharacterized protein TPAR_00204 [Tolypocladium paradoxum]|uniref:Duf1665 domain containing protein n=1 Tax=Tolypocladium paradoxum TaxID=94208 RepID=A0A2S4LAZ8_9HYPO|nr:Uncharacterized protein TPAR_00204 [Tolypocladium paradoxum]
MQFVIAGSASLSESQKRQFNEWVRSQEERPGRARAMIYINATFGIAIPPSRVKELTDSALGVTVVTTSAPAPTPPPPPEPKPRPNPTLSDPIKLPGYGLPLNYMPPRRRRFPVLMGGGKKDWAARTLLIREVCMLRFMEDITNKPEWWHKVRDPKIVAKWKREVQRMNWGEYRRHADFTCAMAVACIQELRNKATLYEETGLIPVLDYSACVVKSDKLISNDLTERLKAALAPLENVPEDRKDWHPGSDEKVLDLVHPSLWPLLHGKSRIMRHQRIGIKECLDYCGRGFVVPTPEQSELTVRKWWGGDEPIASLSTRFQWLPCDVAVDENGGAQIESYINNLHPAENAELYPIIQSFIEKSLPAWDLIYRWVRDFPVQRLKTKAVGRRVAVPDAVPEGGDQGSNGDEGEEGEGVEDLPQLIGEEPEEQKNKYYNTEDEEDDDVDEDVGGDDDDDDYDDSDDDDEDDSDEEGHYKEPSRYFKLSAEKIKSSGFFNGTSRIQVIVKLANIHLTPDKPSYDGGSWHIEGQLNEHICATALFYYDSENITESRLAFRTPANAENLGRRLKYRQNDNRSVERAFAIRSGFDTLQDVGSVLTRPGRALFFPNLFQHRVQPFSLADPLKPGHRKILALFLVDPAIPVMSTANVPPQQRHWWKGETVPPEVAEMVTKNIDTLIGEDEARGLREELMAERTVMQEDTESKLRQVRWSFCEH